MFFFQTYYIQQFQVIYYFIIYYHFCSHFISTSAQKLICKVSLITNSSLILDVIYCTVIQFLKLYLQLILNNISISDIFLVKIVTHSSFSESLFTSFSCNFLNKNSSSELLTGYFFECFRIEQLADIRIL